MSCAADGRHVEAEQGQAERKTDVSAALSCLRHLGSINKIELAEVFHSILSPYGMV
jgi:hypothetical protein